MNPETLKLLAARRAAAEAQLERLLALPESERQGPRGGRRAWEQAVNEGRKLLTIVSGLPGAAVDSPAQKRMRATHAAVLGKVTLDGRRELCLSIRNWGGARAVDVRVWRVPKAEAAPFQTKTGFTLTPGQVDALIAALVAVRQQL